MFIWFTDLVFLLVDLFIQVYYLGNFIENPFEWFPEQL